MKDVKFDKVIGYLKAEDVFGNEKKFTRWLSKNLDYLTFPFGRQFTLIDREKPIGAFWEDILMMDEEGGKWVIEAQYNLMDHDHHSKTITYPVLEGAVGSIWICERWRPEFFKVLEELNTFIPHRNYYVCQLTIQEKENGTFTPEFRIIFGPTIEEKQRGELQRKESRDYEEAHKFLHLFRNSINEENSLFSDCNPSTIYLKKYIEIGMAYQIAVTKTLCHAGIWFIHKKNAELNFRRYEELKEHKDTIESIFNGNLNWRESGVQERGLTYDCKMGGVRNPEKWGQVISELQKNFLDLYNIVDPIVQNIS